MKFTYPEFLWALFFLLVPLIVHLFNFRRYKILYFSSLQFIKSIDKETRNTQRLKHLLVLLSRILALGFLIIAFAQPFQPVEKYEGKGGKPVVAIYVDNSFSMTAKGTEGELISEARETARKIINKSSLQTLFLLHTNLMNGTEERLISKVEALDYLDKITIIPLTRTIADVLSWQRSIVKKESETKRPIRSVQYVLLSDFQKKELFVFNVQKDDRAYYYPILLTPQFKQNLSVDSVWFSSPIRKIGENNELNIRIRNFGDEALSNAEVHVEIGSIKRDVFLDVAANSSTVTIVNYSESTSGVKKGKITVNDRQLFWDDDFYFSYVLDNETSVLVINGENSNAPVSSVFALENYYNQKVIRESEFSADQLNKMDLVVLNGMNSISTGMTDELIDFCSSGGTLAIFPGSKADFNSYRDLLSRLKLPLLNDVSSTGVNIRRLAYEDPFFTGMFEKKKEDLHMPTLKSMYRTSSSSSSDFFPLLETENGSPLFIRSGGNYNAFLFCSSLESDFGNFTNNALFPSIILRIGEMSQRKAPVFLIIGNEAYYPLYSRSENETPVHIKSDKMDFIPRIEKRGLITYISLNGQEAIEMLEAGNYDIFDEKVQAPLSLNYNRSESATDFLNKSDIINLFKAKGLTKVSAHEVNEGQSAAYIDIEKPFEYWKWMVALSLLFLLTELALLKFWK